MKPAAQSGRRRANTGISLLQHLIETYGYAAVALGTFLEGEVILVLAGFAAYSGYLELEWVMLCAFIGSLTGDQLYFYVGRHFGARIIRKRLSWQASADRVYRLLERHQVILILSFRFLYGVRSVAPFAIGASHRVPRLRFFALNAIGAAVWAVAVAWGGYLFGKTLQLLFEDVQRYETYALIALVILGLVVWVTSLVRRRRRAARQAID
jgi:membrane protein DedA with SNARE-associated domain